MSSIFLAHSSKDKRFARRLATALRERGFRVWIDEAELLVGDSLFEKIGGAITDMDFLGVILSPNAAESSWVQREVEIALQQEIQTQRTKVLPILYKPCSVPVFLQSRLWADFTKRDSFDVGVRALATRVASSLSLGADVLEAWQPKAVRLGLRFGVLETTPSGPAFTKKFLEALKQRMAQEPEKFNVNVLLATLDTTPRKITEEELVEFGNQAKDQLIPYFLGLAIRSDVIAEVNGGLVMHDSLKIEALDHFAKSNYADYQAFREDAKTLIREMVTARLVLKAPDCVTLGPAIAPMVLLIFDHNEVLRALWEGGP
jgi:hypothetical protein